MWLKSIIDSCSAALKSMQTQRPIFGRTFGAILCLSVVAAARSAVPVSVCLCVPPSIPPCTRTCVCGPRDRQLTASCPCAATARSNSNVVTIVNVCDGGKVNACRAPCAEGEDRDRDRVRENRTISVVQCTACDGSRAHEGGQAVNGEWCLPSVAADL